MKPNNVTLRYLSDVANADEVRLIGISPYYEYENGVKTDKPAGQNLECMAEKNRFEKFNTKVADLNPIITPE